MPLEMTRIAATDQAKYAMSGAAHPTANRPHAPTTAASRIFPHHVNTIYPKPALTNRIDDETLMPIPPGADGNCVIHTATFAAVASKTQPK